MNQTFAETIRQLRTERGLSQAQLAEQMYVTRSAVARWESGSRMPDAMMIVRLAKCLGTNTEALFSLLSDQEDIPNIIMVDDEKIILSGGLPVLEEVFQYANITGFTKPSEAISYALNNRVALAFLDIEMGKHNGLDLCRELQQINPHTNVIFLTAYMDYSLDAWKTGASGFIIKPITAAEILSQLPRLRFPLGGMKANDESN
ncbi:MAG: response regulator [Clostridia bacterium]|nr:response regulator [Clostridia bacterium]